MLSLIIVWSAIRHDCCTPFALAFRRLNWHVSYAYPPTHPDFPQSLLIAKFTSFDFTNFMKSRFVCKKNPTVHEVAQATTHCHVHGHYDYYPSPTANNTTRRISPKFVAFVCLWRVSCCWLSRAICRVRCTCFCFMCSFHGVPALVTVVL